MGGQKSSDRRERPLAGPSGHSTGRSSGARARRRADERATEERERLCPLSGDPLSASLAAVYLASRAAPHVALCPRRQLLIFQRGEEKSAESDPNRSLLPCPLAPSLCLRARDQMRRRLRPASRSTLQYCFAAALAAQILSVK
uniref:Uncharacterized protein n=1 Tax=Plectus sambesii TaxID=2011161 RepID=A0A914VGQ0_9BILA